MAVAVELMFIQLATQRIAVNAEHLSSARLIALGVVEHALDEFFLEFRERFLKQNAAVDHLANQGFELILHEKILRIASPQGPTRGRNR